MMIKAGESLKRLADAQEPLYQSLDDSQKNRFQILSRVLRHSYFAQMRGHGGMMQDHHSMMQRHHGMMGGERGMMRRDRTATAMTGGVRAACVAATVKRGGGMMDGMGERL